jgi:D-hexose-6-phosphate mutarotase
MWSPWYHKTGRRHAHGSGAASGYECVETGKVERDSAGPETLSNFG